MIVPTVSVIIPTYKEESEPYLYWCLWSLLRQNIPLEIIIVADGDAGPERIIYKVKRSVEETMFPPLLPNIKVIRPKKERTRFSEKNNIAIKEASSHSSFFLLMNDDFFPCRDMIKQMIDASLSYENKCVTGALSNCDNNGMLFRTGLNFHNQLRLNDKINKDMPMVFESIPFTKPFFFEVPRIYFYNVLIPRKAYEEIGPLDEEMLHAYEDTDYAIRARLLGYKLIIAQNAYGIHFSGVTSSVATKEYERIHDEQRFLSKHGLNCNMVK